MTELTIDAAGTTTAFEAKAELWSIVSKVNDCSTVKGKISSTHDILKIVSWDLLNLWIID